MSLKDSSKTFFNFNGTTNSIVGWDRVLAEKEVNELYNNGYSFSFFWCEICKKTTKERGTDCGEMHTSVDLV